MRYNKVFYFPHETTQEQAEEVIKHRRAEILADAVIFCNVAENGAEFTVKYIEKFEEEMDVETFYGKDGLKGMYVEVDIEPVKRYYTVIHSAEDRYLIPQTSFKKKLKNCYAYMKDKLGDTIELEEREC